MPCMSEQMQNEKPSLQKMDISHQGIRVRRFSQTIERSKGDMRKDDFWVEKLVGKPY